jgi:hypothetical protein
VYDITKSFSVGLSFHREDMDGDMKRVISIGFLFISLEAVFEDI